MWAASCSFTAPAGACRPLEFIINHTKVRYVEMGTRPKRATLPSVIGTLALARRHKAGAEDDEGRENRRCDRQHQARRSHGGCCRPANRRKRFCEGRHTRGDLTTAELTALG